MQKKRGKYNRRVYSDDALIALYRAGEIDSDIGRRLGVTTQYVKERRDALGLPPLPPKQRQTQGEWGMNVKDYYGDGWDVQRQRLRDLCGYPEYGAMSSSWR